MGENWFWEPLVKSYLTLDICWKCIFKYLHKNLAYNFYIKRGYKSPFHSNNRWKAEQIEKNKKLFFDP